MGKLVNSRSLMQPFLVGAPSGRGAGGNGEADVVSDDRFREAFPDCVHNRWMENKEPPLTYDEYLRRKLGYGAAEVSEAGA